jgi:hypothetical protein
LASHFSLAWTNTLAYIAMEFITAKINFLMKGLHSGKLKPHTIEGGTEKVYKFKAHFYKTFSETTSSNNLLFFTITKCICNLIIMKNGTFAVSSIFLQNFYVVYLFRAALYGFYLELCKVRCSIRLNLLKTTPLAFCFNESLYNICLKVH